MLVRQPSYVRHVGPAPTYDPHKIAIILEALAEDQKCKLRAIQSPGMLAEGGGGGVVRRKNGRETGKRR